MAVKEANKLTLTKYIKNVCTCGDDLYGGQHLMFSMPLVRKTKKREDINFLRKRTSFVCFVHAQKFYLIIINNFPFNSSLDINLRRNSKQN